MAEIMASAVLKAVIQKLSEEAVKQVGRVKGIRSELKSLEKSLYRNQALLVDASDKEITNELVQKWLNDLKHLVYHIDDFLDDLATDAMDPDFVKNSGASSSRVRKLISSCCTCTNLSLYTKIHHPLDNINRQLKDLETERRAIGLEVKNGGFDLRKNRSKDKNRGLQTPVVDASSIIGRQGDKDELIDKLLGDDPRNKNNFSIVPIFGMGGVGKTTLAKLLYNDKQVHSHFDLKAWVCVSEEWDIFQITKSIFQYVGGDDKKFENIGLLQGALQDKLRGKKFLLVLDDIWTESYEDWKTLEGPFSACTRGSKVIITTRKDQLLKQLLSKVDSGQLKQLKCLSHNDAVSLFCQNAFDEDNFSSYQTLEAHGEALVEKCNGLPLALIALGRLLRRKGTDEERWKEVVDSQIWCLEEGGGILNSLKLSYHELPASLKQLFAYCSLFPKDDLFEKDGLVLLWMAEGFLHQSDPSKTEERLGHDYFEELLSRSFFQHTPDDKSLFVMHDLMHDLATSVAGEFFFRSEKDMGKDGRKPAMEKLRHMSFVRGEHEAYEKYKEANYLRTFLSVGVTNTWFIYILPNNFLAELLPKLQLLRVLHVSGYNLSEVPEYIGSLKHLRYINFSGTHIRNLPETVGDLYNLQTLIVFGCSRLSKLPNNFSKLKNLRHLDIRTTPWLKDMPLGIGELKSLQTLSKIIIGGENDFSIAQLKDLKNLRGSVSIQGLNKVKKATEAREANLSQKKLNELELEWSDVSDGSIKETDIKEVLDALKPYDGDLKKLKIVNYCGLVFLKWVGDASFHLLACVSIRGCKNCTSLPPFAQLQSLKELHIQGMDNVKFVGSEFLGNGVSFPSLEVLSFKDMPGWEVWSSNGRSITGVVGDVVFPCLKELRINGCPSLNEFSFKGDAVFPCLKELHIIDFPSLVEFSFEGNEVFSCLKVLHINDCSSLNEVSFKGAKVFPFLQELCIKGCLKLPKVSVEALLPSLRVLTIARCGDGVLRSFVRAAPSVTEALTSLSSLEVWNCDNLKHLSCPSNIEELSIMNCPSVTCVSYFSKGGGQKLKSVTIVMCEKLLLLKEESGEEGDFIHLTDDGVWPPNLCELKIGLLKKPISEWGPQKFPSTLVP